MNQLDFWHPYIDLRNVKDGLKVSNSARSENLSANPVLRFLNQLCLKSNWVTQRDFFAADLEWRKVKGIWKLLLSLSQMFSRKCHCLADLSVQRRCFYLTYPCSDSPKCQCHLYGFLPHIYCQKHYHEILACPSYFVCYINPDHTSIDLIRFSNSPICAVFRKWSLRS